MRQLMWARTTNIGHKTMRALLFACVSVAVLPDRAEAKRAKAIAPSAAPAAAITPATSPEIAAPPAAPTPTPAPPLAAPVATNNLGADNAKDLDPAIDPQWTISDRRPHERPQHLSLSFGVWPPTSISSSIWYAIPIVPNGFISSINDSFDIEFGAVIAGYFDGLDHGAVIPAVGGRWNFHVTHNFIPFVTLKLDMQLGFGPGDPNLFGVDMTLGTLLRLSDWAYLRAELGYPQGIAVGVSFPIGG